MEYIIKGYKPESFFRFFEEISAVPRGSYNEKGIMQYLANFAKERGFEHYTDETYNIIIKKPASSGCETLPAVIFQGHTDIVCEKNNGTVHNFETDPLPLYIDDGILRARGTTLGADNGTAVAYMLALLDADNLRHPPLECIFTSQEEVGLVGAFALDCTPLTGKRMINMDSGSLGRTVAGSAGGVMMHLAKTIAQEPAKGHALAVSITGLQGGHSAGAIDLSRGNPLKILAFIMQTLLTHAPMVLASIEGGSKDNAIPREADAILVFETEEARAAAAATVLDLARELKAQYGQNDPGLTVTTENAPLPETAFTKAFTEELVRLMVMAPHGVVYRNMALNNALIASVNFASIHSAGGVVRMAFTPRSSDAVLKAQMKQQVQTMADVFNYNVTLHGDFPGWRYTETSFMRDVFNAVCQEVLGEGSTVVTTHGGLECGVFADKIPGIDIIAIGPNAGGGHTPEEWLNLASCETQWQIIVGILEKLAAEK